VAAGHAQLLAARALSGFGGGLLFTSASAAVADMVPYHRRAAAMGVFTAGMFLAVPVGLPAALALAGGGEDGWRRAFGWLLLPALLALAGIARAVPARLGGGAPKVSQLAVLRAPHVGAALLSVMLYTGAFFTVVQFAPKWLDEDGVLPKSEQGWLWLGIGLSTAAGALVLPRLADRVGKRTAVLATTAGAAICLVLLARVESVLGLVAIGLGMSMLAAARTPSLQALMSEIVEPRQRGTLMGLRAAAINLGAAAFGAFGAAVYASHGFRVLAAAAAAAMAAAYVAVRFGVRVKL
jgi:DHA1 family inner membrane transport protein